MLAQFSQRWADCRRAFLQIFGNREIVELRYYLIVAVLHGDGQTITAARKQRREVSLF
jgi:hypothetical protein